MLFRRTLVAATLALTLFSALPHAQERFITQSGGRGLINAKMDARLAKTEKDVDVVEAELATVQEHAKVPAPLCPDINDKLRWNGTLWSCDQETDPTVLAFAKEPLPTCNAGEVLQAKGTRFECTASGAVTEEVDPTVQDFAKQILPSCAAGQVLGVNATLTDFTCVTDTKGLTVESDPFVQNFARTSSPLPDCSSGEVLKADNGNLFCVSDDTGITVESDPTVQSFADNTNYTLAACPDNNVLKASTISGEIRLECVADAGSDAAAIALNDLSDVDTSAQASNTVLMYDGSTWVASTELDPNVQAFALKDYALSICGSGEILTTNADATQLICTTDAGSSGNPLNLNDLGDVSTAGATSNSILTYNGSNWAVATEQDPTVEAFAQNTLPTCSAGQILTGDGTSLSCVADAGGSAAALGITDLSDVTISSAASDQVLRYNGSAWVNSSDNLGALTNGSWCHVASGEVVCDRGAPLACTPPNVIQWNSSTNVWQCVDVTTSVAGGLALADLSDTSFTSLATGQRITWNGTNWVNEDKNYIISGDTQFVVSDSGTGTAQIQVDGNPVFTATAGLLTAAQPLTVTGNISATTIGTTGNTVIGGTLTSGALTATGNSTINGDLTVTGNLLTNNDLTVGGVTFAGGGISATGDISATNFYGDGSNLSNVTASSADWHTLTNIPTTVQDVSSATPTDGNILVGDGSNFITESGNTARTSLGLGTGDNVQFANISATAIEGTLQTSVQPNVTSVGTLTGLGVAGTTSLSDVTTNDTTVNGTLTVNGEIVTTSDLTVGGVTFAGGGISATGDISATNFYGDGSNLSNVTASGVDWYNVTSIPTGVQDISNTALTTTELGYLQGTDQSLATTNNVTFANVTADITTTNADINGGTIDATTIGQTIAATASFTTLDATSVDATTLSGTLQTAAQPNVTSVGTLTGLGVAGTTSLSDVTTNDTTVNGTLTVNGEIVTTSDLTVGGVTFAGGGISATGDISATNFYGDGSNLTNVTANLTDRIVSDTTSVVTNDGMDTISFTTAGTERMAIDASGNVGIGTAAPSATLHIEGDFIARKSNGNALTINGQSINSVNATLAINESNDVDSSFGGNDLYIDASVNSVGIGTTSPSKTLHVAGEIISNNILGAPAGSTGGALGFYSDGGYQTGYQAWGSTSANPSALALVTAGASRIFVDGVGNVGIGTTAPTRTLDVSVTNNSGGIALTSSAGQEVVSLRETTARRGLIEVKDEDGDTAWDMRAYSDFGVLSGYSAGVLSVRISSDDSVDTYFNAGDVGIRTTSPATALHISGTLRIANGGETASTAGAGAIKYDSGDLYFSDGSTWTALASSAATVTTLSDADGDTTITLQNTGDTDTISFTTAGTERMVIDASGNVGIGTTAPSTELEVSGTVTATGLEITDGTGYNYSHNSAGDFVLQSAQGGDILQIVDAGATDADDANPYLEFNHTTGVGGSLSRLGYIGFAASTNAGLTILNDSLTDGISFRSGGNNVRLQIEAGGDIGIGGITNPTTALDVSGTVTADYFVGDGSGLTNLSVSGDRIVSDTTSVVVNDGVDTISFTTAGTERMVIDASGNVGIGTDTPTAALEISPGHILLNPTNTTLEGGQVTLAGAASYDAWTIDSYTHNLRLFTNSSNNNQVQIFNNLGGGAGLYVEGNVGIGTTAPATALHVSGTLRIADGGETASTAGAGAIKYDSGDLYFSDGSTWTTLAAGTAGANAINDLTDAEYNLTTNNLFLGTSYTTPLVNDTHNVAIGRYALDALTDSGTGNEGDSNTALGYSAMTANTTGYYNTAVGRSALFSNTTGYQNAAFGMSALRDNTEGYNNVAVGIYSLVNNTTGDLNTSTGVSSMLRNEGGLRNTAFGTYSLYNNTEGDYNTAIGMQSLYDISGTTPNNNTALGYNTGRGIVTGDANTILGANVTGLASDLSNTVIIADGDGNQRIYVDSSGNVGVGTTVPSNTLHVQNSALSGFQARPQATAVFENSATTELYLASSSIGQIRFGDAATNFAGSISYDHNFDAFRFYTTGLERMHINSSGNVGVGTITPQTALHVSGTLRIANGGETASTAGAGAIKYDSGDLYFSDGSSWSALAAGSATRTSITDIDGDTTITLQNTGDTDTISFTTAGTERMVIDASGNVGIGTDSPGYALHVSDSSLVDIRSEADAYAKFSWKVRNAGTDQKAWQMFAQEIDDSLIIGTINDAENAATVAMQTFRDSGYGIDKITFPNGNIGIGTTTPAATLDVSGTAFLGTNEADYVAALGGGGTARLEVAGSNTNANLAFSSKGAGDIYFWTQGYGTNAAALIDGATGNFGVGTTAPATALDVSGTLRIADGGETASTAGAGAIKYDSGDLYVSDGSTWTALAAGTAGASSINDLTDAEYNLTTNNMFIGTSYTTPLVNNTQNVAIGRYALNSLTDSATGTEGDYNTAVGYAALTANTTGYYNTAVGRLSLFQNTTGYNNVANGLNALYYNTTGYNNTAVGVSSLNHNTEGYHNTAIGRSALFNNTEGAQNTGVGMNVLYDISGTTANNNTALGRNTGRGIVTGDANTILGANVTGLASDLSNTVIIADGDGNQRIYVDSSGNVGIGTLSPSLTLDVDGSIRSTRYSSDDTNIETISGQYSPTRIVYQFNEGRGLGYNSADNRIFFAMNETVPLVLDNNGNVGINTTAPITALDVSGTLRIADGGETASTAGAGAIKYDSGDLYFSDGSTWTALAAGSAGASSINDLTDAEYNLTTNNMFIGTSYTTPLVNNTQNVAIGQYALDALNDDNTQSYYGDYNTALGYAALTNNTTGYANSASGRYALFSNTEGYYNTASGLNALYTNTEGHYNTASGVNALYANTEGYYNTASGVSALFSNTTGYNNTASGVGALRSNTTGIRNTASGHGALFSNTTGNYNTASGRYALYNNTTGNYNTASGVNALYDISGTTANNNTALGYNTGRGIVTGDANTILGANVTGLASDLSNTVIIADGDGNQRIYVDSEGDVGIGTTTPSAKLHVYSGGTGLGLYVANSGSATSAPLYVNNVGSGNSFVVNDEASDATPFVIDSIGRVGVGTTSPSATLHVSGTVKVAGTGSETCNPSTYGTFRFNPVTQKTQLCRP